MTMLATCWYLAGLEIKQQHTSSCTDHHQPLARLDAGILDSLPSLAMVMSANAIQRRLLVLPDTTHLIGSQSSAQHGPHDHRIDVLRQHCQVACIQRTILLETAIAVVKMILRSLTVLLAARQTKLAFVADPCKEADSDKSTKGKGCRGAVSGAVANWG